MEELKQELTMDEHKVPITELYSRLSTDPTTVSDLKRFATVFFEFYFGNCLEGQNPCCIRQGFFPSKTVPKGKVNLVNFLKIQRSGVGLQEHLGFWG